MSMRPCVLWLSKLWLHEMFFVTNRRSLPCNLVMWQNRRLGKIYSLFLRWLFLKSNHIWWSWIRFWWSWDDYFWNLITFGGVGLDFGGVEMTILNFIYFLIFLHWCLQQLDCWIKQNGDIIPLTTMNQ